MVNSLELAIFLYPHEFLQNAKLKYDVWFYFREFCRILPGKYLVYSTLLADRCETR